MFFFAHSIETSWTELKLWLHTYYFIFHAKISFATLTLDRQTITGETSGDDDHVDAVAAFRVVATDVATWTGVTVTECPMVIMLVCNS